MTRYENLKDKPKRFLSLTGYMPEEFSALVPYFSDRFLEFVETRRSQEAPEKNASIAVTKTVVYQLLKISCCLF